MMTLEDLDVLIKERRAEHFRKNGSFVEVSGAGIDWLTPEERSIRHELIMTMPTAAEEREAARARIAARIAARKNA